MPQRNTDELLLERAETGDQAAFLQVYETHRDAVYRFAYRISGTVEAAEDLTHDCFLSLIQKPGNYDPNRAALRTYLFSAARNLWLKQLRKVGRESGLDSFPEDQFIDVGKEPLHRLLDDELSLKVQEAVLSLPPMQLEAIVLFEYEGLTLNEIADMIGTDIGAVKGRLHRARERLRSTLQPYLYTHREIVTLEKA